MSYELFKELARQERDTARHWTTGEISKQYGWQAEVHRAYHVGRWFAFEEAAALVSTDGAGPKERSQHEHQHQG